MIFISFHGLLIPQPLVPLPPTSRFLIHTSPFILPNILNSSKSLFPPFTHFSLCFLIFQKVLQRIRAQSLYDMRLTPSLFTGKFHAPSTQAESVTRWVLSSHVMCPFSRKPLVMSSSELLVAFHECSFGDTCHTDCSVI